MDTTKYRYDVFLSFRGEDTRHGFTGFLVDALRREGLFPYMDDEGLKKGDYISLFTLKAIEESRVSIIVLSENYASSSWCLQELVKILETRKKKNLLVMPIFYKVDPSDVKHQRNKYGEAMAAHEKRFSNEIWNVNEWRSALSEIGNLSGLYFETGYEYEFIRKIVKDVAAKLRPKQLSVDEYPIGFQSRLEEVMSLLHIESGDKVFTVGIHGLGGIGKTTLARGLFNLISDQFDCAAFLRDIRQNSGSMGLVHVQKELLSLLFEGENKKLRNVDEGVAILKLRLKHRRILLVLDDVDHVEQLQKLAGGGNWFGSGSRIIITTRDKQLLIAHQVEKIYEMKPLNDDEAFQLFCWNAFKKSQSPTDYENLSRHVVRYANGLPLALKVLGSSLAGRSLEYWGKALKRDRMIPDRMIHDILKISYDSLDDIEKNVFLDIACFFNGENLEYVKTVLDKCYGFAPIIIEVLVDKSLLTVEDGRLKMHPLIQDRAKEIVRQEVLAKPGECSRLCFDEDVLEVLTKNSGSSLVKGIILDPPKRAEVKWRGTAFKMMTNLQILIVRNAHFSSGPDYLPNSLRLLEWKEYPSESLPNIPRNAVVLSLPDSYLKLEKEKPLPKLEHLTYINFSDCQFMTDLPDVSGVPNLRNLRLDGCINLIAVHNTVGFLGHLVFLSASHCIKLRSFLPRIQLPSLEYLDLHLTRIEHFPEILGVMDKLIYISLEHTCIKELPNSVVNLIGLQCLQMQYCINLSNLPSALFMLPKFEELWLHGSPQVQDSFRRFQSSRVVAATGQPNLRKLYFPSGGLTDEDLQVILSCFPKLEELHIPSNCFASLPAVIKESHNLKVLDVSHSKKLQELPEQSLSNQRVIATHCPLLTSETSRMLWSQLLFTDAPESWTLHMNYCHSDGELLTRGRQAGGSHHK